MLRLDFLDISDFSLARRYSIVQRSSMIVHMLDGTYELFRHYYGLQRAKQHKHPFSAVAGLLRTVVQMIEEGATHLGSPPTTSSSPFAIPCGRDTKLERASSRP